MLLRSLVPQCRPILNCFHIYVIDVDGAIVTLKLWKVSNCHLNPLYFLFKLMAALLKETLQAMQMLSTSELSIKWLLKGRPKNRVFAILGGELMLQINSRFILNQISGQVIEHEELWDLSASSIVGQSYFWISRMLFSATEAGKDAIDAVKSFGTNISSEKDNTEIYPDLSGDPTKFFQRDDRSLGDAYQIALLLAIIYFVVQFLRTTL